MENSQYSLSSKRITEAYEVVATSMDEVFQTDLYDWYLEQGRTESLLEIQSPFVERYLERKSVDDIVHANLLWKYYAQAERYNDAAAIQLALAKSAFTLTLDKRIEFLSLAKANANTYLPGIARPARQVLLREISDLLEIANIQDDLLQRLKGDERVTPTRKPEVLRGLDGSILSLSDVSSLPNRISLINLPARADIFIFKLYNLYADQASYFDICLQIYQAADHRNPADIRATWKNLIDRTHEEVLARGESQPYEGITAKIRSLGPRLNLSETTFPIADLVPMLKQYAFEYQNGVGPETWVTDVLIDIGIPFESLFPILESMYYSEEAPFQGRNRRHIAVELVHVAQRWYESTSRGPGLELGGEENAAAVDQTLRTVLQSEGLDKEKAEICMILRTKIAGALR